MDIAEHSILCFPHKLPVFRNELAFYVLGLNDLAVVVIFIFSTLLTELNLGNFFSNPFRHILISKLA